MKTGGVKRFAKKSISLANRLTRIMIVVALCCVFMLSAAAIHVMDIVEQNRLYTSLRKDAGQIDEQMNQEYLSLVHLSQQLIPQGSVGRAISDYLASELPYEKIERKQALTESMSTATFGNPQVGLVEYFSYGESGEKEVFFSNLPAKQDFKPLKQWEGANTREISFQGIHNAGNRFENKDVVSLVREIIFADGIERHLYIEVKTNVTKSIEEIVKQQKIPYTLLQLDKNGTIKFSTEPAFQVGRVFAFQNPTSEKGEVGRADGYVWCSGKKHSYFRNVLLLPEDYYDKEANMLMWSLFGVSLLVMAMILFLSFMMRNQFYRPLKELEKEMESFGQGNLNAQKYNTGIIEYDSVFFKFEEMKGQIAILVNDIYIKEGEKRQLELDKLYFQLNPHFIMNALNSAQWQAKMDSSPELAEYLSNLNYLLAYTLGKVNGNTTFRSEIQVLEAYLKLQQTRQDFSLHWNVEEGLYLDRRCARMVLQPIAENAVCHNIDEFGNFRIDIKAFDGIVEIVIEDDGVGFNPKTLSFKDMPEIGMERDSKNGIGLRYVWLTLESVYKGSADMQVKSALGEGTRVTIRMPEDIEDKQEKDSGEKGTQPE